MVVILLSVLTTLRSANVNTVVYNIVDLETNITKTVYTLIKILANGGIGLVILVGVTLTEVIVRLCAIGVHKTDLCAI